MSYFEDKSSAWLHNVDNGTSLISCQGRYQTGVSHLAE